MADWAPLLLAIGVPCAAFTLLGRASPAARALAAMTCVLFGLRYLWWRWTASMPLGQGVWQQVWAWIFLFFETATAVGVISSYIFMSRTSNRSREVDGRPDSPLYRAAVDVFIPTYNEDRDILERTIVGARGIEHDDLRVWVLDDGARPWVALLAADLGALYCQRIGGLHAKAGNVNEGLLRALSIGRPPEFILLLDADFVPARTILKRTLPLFEPADVGIVQTPQHFFNADPIQANLLCGSVWPDEQRFFFNYLQPSKDAWGAAFCCGTSAVYRVAALARSGGMATTTVTEDMLTSFQLYELGYRTVFLNERLSLGLAPEGLGEYISQRSRWCLGSMQQIHTRWGFAGFARVGLMNRLSALEGVMFWAASFTFKMMMISAPMVYWWTGTSVIAGTAAEITTLLGPYLASGIVFNAVLTGHANSPVMTDLTHLLSAPTVLRTAAMGLVKPWGHRFKVTNKGVATQRAEVQWGMMLPFALVAAGTAAGLLAHLSPFSALRGTSGYSVNMVWSLFSIAVLAMACAVCVELPKRRRDERFTSGEAAILVFTNDAPRHCTVLDISVGGARLTCAEGWALTAPDGELLIANAEATLRFTTIRTNQDGALAIHFQHDDESRRSLIRKLFTGDYHNEVQRVDIFRTLLAALRMVFR